MLQQATRTGDYELYKKYSHMISEEMDPVNIRGLFDFNFAETPVPLDEVESVDSIVKRFKTGAMSYGSISQEAHRFQVSLQVRFSSLLQQGADEERILQEVTELQDGFRQLLCRRG